MPADTSSTAVNPWFELTTDEDLAQGDILLGFDIPFLHNIPREDEEAEFSIQEFDLVLMSQTCDIINGKLDDVLVSALFTFEKLQETNQDLQGRGGKEKVRKGVFPNLHLLNRFDHPDLAMDYRIANFRNTYSIPLKLVQKSLKKPRPRLISPYREHLSQSFARFFMRVALPVDIPKFN